MDFTIIELCVDDCGFVSHKFLKKYSFRRYKKYLLKKLPVEIKKFVYFNEEGRKFILPIKKEEVELYGLDFIIQFINNLKIKYDFSDYFFNDEIRQVIQKEKENEKEVLKYLMLEDVMEIALRQTKISWKNVKLIIVDSMDSKVQIPLELFMDKLNYLTILTPREEYFTAFKEMIYENTGLLVETISDYTKEALNGNVVIDMNTSTQKEYLYLPQDALVIDLENTKEKRQYLYSRRKDLKIATDIIIKSQEANFDDELFSSFLIHFSWIIRHFYESGEKTCSAKELSNLVRKYNISIIGLKGLNS